MSENLIVNVNAKPSDDWWYAAELGGIDDTTARTIKAAVMGAKNYITGMQIHATALTTTTEIVIRDGSGGTVLWRSKVPSAGTDQNSVLGCPISSSINTLLEVVLLTDPVVGQVYFNAQGFVRGN